MAEHAWQDVDRGTVKDVLWFPRPGGTFLMDAVKRDDVEGTCTILAACPTENERLVLANTPYPRDARWYAPLCSALSGDMARVLLEAGADPFEESAGAVSIPCAAACRRADPGVLAVLLVWLGDGPTSKKRVQRLLFSEAAIDDSECDNAGAHVQLLLDAGADPQAVDCDGRDAIEIFVRAHTYSPGFEECDMPIDMLDKLLAALPSDDVRRERVNRPDGKGVTLLMHARRDDIARLLLDAGADVWAVDCDGHTALWHAMHDDALVLPSDVEYGGHASHLLGELLAAMGIFDDSVEWSERPERPYEPFYGYTAAKKKPPVRDNAPPPPENGHLPDVLWQIVRIVAAHGHTREAAKVMLAVADLRNDEELLARTALVASRRTGDTLLMDTVKRDKVERACAILAACPTPAARLVLVKAPNLQPVFATPLCNALSGPMACVLLEAGAGLQSDGAVNDPFVAACGRADPNVLAALLKLLGSDAARQARAQPLVMHACTAAHVGLLKGAGANILAVDVNGRDAIDRLNDAAGSSHAAVLAALLASLGPIDSQARVNRPGGDGRTLLMSTASASTARALLDAGADVRAVGGDGRDALDAAVDDDKCGVAGVLLAALGSIVARSDRVNHPDANGATLLMHAQHLKMMRVLLAAGADVWAVDTTGRGVLDSHLQHRAALGFLLEEMGIQEDDVYMVRRK